MTSTLRIWNDNELTASAYKLRTEQQTVTVDKGRFQRAAR